MLKDYAAQHPGDPYAAVAGVWDSENNRYCYQAIPLSFPDKMVQEAAAEPVYYWYRLRDDNHKMLRNLAALIPRVAGAASLMTRWLQVKDRTLVKVILSDSSAGQKAQTQPLQTARTRAGGRNRMQGSCYNYYPETGWILGPCEGTVVVAPRDDGNGAARLAGIARTIRGLPPAGAMMAHTRPDMAGAAVRMTEMKQPKFYLTSHLKTPRPNAYMIN